MYKIGLPLLMFLPSDDLNNIFRLFLEAKAIYLVCELDLVSCGSEFVPSYNIIF